MSLTVSDSDMQREINQGALQQLWEALIKGQDTTKIYRNDAILRAPQVDERMAGQADIGAHGQLESGEQLVKVNSIVGDGGVWVSECETLWHQKKTLLISVAEMYDGKIMRETRYRVPRQIGSHVPSS